MRKPPTPRERFETILVWMALGLILLTVISLILKLNS
jgi:hypothetical protein